jgi:hypothetical protein
MRRSDIHKIARSYRVVIDAIIEGDIYRSDDLTNEHIADASELIS